MKSIILSVQPKWLEKILNGEKTIEIRKTNPKCELPIDVYLYCSRDKKYSYAVCEYQRGKVVGKFTLNKVDETTPVDLSTKGFDIRKKACLDVEILIKYAGGFSKTDTQLYAWYIDNLVIFDKPKELSEFCVNRDIKRCSNCIYNCYDNHDNGSGEYYCSFDNIENSNYCPITKAPQSYCYCEVEEND